MRTHFRLVLLGLLSSLAGISCAEQQPELTALAPPAQQPAAAQQAGVGVPGDIDRRQLPPPGPPVHVNLPVPERLTLSNGTKVLLVERHTLPVVAVLAVWPVGALEDPADRPGMASLCADMLDEGAGPYGALELAEAFSRLGSRLSIRADFNGTYVSTLALSRNLEPTLKLLTDVLRRPTMAQKDLERVKGDLLTFLSQRRDTPQNLAGDLFEQVLYGMAHRRSAPAVGVAEAVKLIDHYDCRWWHRERLRPDDATLIAVGDFEPAALRARLEEDMSGWRAPVQRKEPPVLATVPEPARRLIAMEAPGKAQTVISIGKPSVPRKHPDYFPLLVTNTILGGQFNSRINMNLREKHGYAYGASSAFAFARDGGPFLIRASVKGESTAASVAEALKEVERLRGGDVTPEEIRQAKEYLSRSLARRFETALQVAGELSVIEVFKLPDNYLQTYADRIEAVTLGDVQRAAREYLDPARMSVVLVGDRKNIDPLAQLNLGLVEYRTLQLPQPPPAK